MKSFPLLLHETATSWRNLLDKRLKPIGLSQAKWRALLLLSTNNEAMTQIQLAKQLSLEAPTVVGLIDRLSKEGWVYREDSLADRRAKVIRLTAKAKSTIHEIKLIATKLNDEILATVNPDELKACMDLFINIKQRIEVIDE